MSFILQYTQQTPKGYLLNDLNLVTTELVVKDDLGNVYEGQGNGGMDISQGL
ncbi:hypothetical protein [Geosporobacter ferrireducens]